MTYSADGNQCAPFVFMELLVEWVFVVDSRLKLTNPGQELERENISKLYNGSCFVIVRAYFINVFKPGKTALLTDWASFQRISTRRFHGSVWGFSILDGAKLLLSYTQSSLMYPSKTHLQ